MADLLLKEDLKTLSVSRGQQVAGIVVAILAQEILLDLGVKSEGVLQKKDLSPEQAANLKVGDKLLTFVIQPENESGQIVLALQKAVDIHDRSSQRWRRFDEALKQNQTLLGKGIEVNKGGLIVEVAGIRGFLPSSQMALSQATKLEELVGKDLNLTVIEVDPSQNRLIFSQKTNVSEDIKQKLTKLKVGDKVKGQVAAVLAFGIFVALEGNIEGLVHVSEISWDKVEDPNSLFKVGDEVEAKVISIDGNTGKVNLSIKQLTEDPFSQKVKKIQVDDVVKGVVSKINSMGIFVDFVDIEGVEGLIHSSKLDGEQQYKIGDLITCLVGSIDIVKRRVSLVPFVTSTKDLIYK